MFDDQPLAAPPTNLPMEPEDMFKETENIGKDIRASTPNALEAGVLKKKIPLVDTMPSELSGAPIAASERESVASLPLTREPVVGKILVITFTAAMVGALAYGGWWLYQRYLGTTISSPVPPQGLPLGDRQNVPTEPPPTPATTAALPSAPVAATAQTPSTSDTATKVKSDSILFGDQTDKDKDGLDDIREQELGTDALNPDSDNDGLKDGEEAIIIRTNPLNPDTDSDGLKDGDEVKLWKTNPLASDSDGDSYPDGKEIYNGYNPLGPGKLPTASTTPIDKQPPTVK